MLDLARRDVIEGVSIARVAVADVTLFAGTYRLREVKVGAVTVAFAVGNKILPEGVH